MIRSMPHKQSRDTVRELKHYAECRYRQLPHILKSGGRWECWTIPGDHSMPARLARDWERFANFKLENAPCSPAC